MTELSTAEAAVVARFEAAADAEESLRSRAARALWTEAVSDLPEASRQEWDDIGQRRRDKYGRLADAVLAVLRGQA